MRLLRSPALTYGVIAGVAALLAGGTVYALEERHSEYSSSATLAVVPISGTGDPDRVVATQIAVLQSRSLRGQVVEAVAGDADFALSASQVRLSNVVTVTATSADPALAVSAVESATSIFAGRTQDPRTAEVSTIDSASQARPVGSASRAAALAAVSAGVLASAALLGFVTARPRVRRAYVDPPENVLLLELPEPTGRGADEASRGALARLSQHLAPHATSTLSVSALPGVGGPATAWVSSVLRELTVEDEALREAGGAGQVAVSPSAVPETTDPQAELALVVARAWVDDERELKRLIASRRAFAEVLVVVLGAQQPSLVPPKGGGADGNGQLRMEEVARRRSRRREEVA